LEPAEVGQQVRGGLGQDDHHGVVVRGGDVGDGGELPGVGELLINDPVVGVGHVLGGEVAAVVEGDVVAQVEGPGEVVVADVPGLGQRRLHLQVLVGLHQGVVHVLQHLEGEVGGGLVRVELVRFAADGHVQHRAFAAAGLVGTGAVDVDRVAGGAGGQQRQAGEPGEDGCGAAHD